jgi:ABC-type transporter Mla subunit MlaD
MTTQEQLDKLTQIFATALESIQALERITATHTEQIGGLTEQIGELTAQVRELTAHQARTDASIRALADEIIATQREWQAYLRRIPPQ